MDLPKQLQETLGPTYKLGRELGGGGMSHVFLAEDTRLGRTVVVKVLSTELAAGISAARFEREIKVAASLQQANIVPLLTAGDTNGLPYFTMPYVEGQSLRARLATGTPLSLKECLGILHDVTRALSYAHQHGVVHRDIKPDNVLLSHGAAVVTDFGIAKAIHDARITKEGEATLTVIGTSVGTPAYMSPEQAAGDPNVDHRTDIYSLGVLAYELLAGQPPFTGTPQAIMRAHLSSPPPPITGRDDIPPSLRRAVMKCLAKEAADRYQSADELLADIEAVSTPSGALPSAVRARPQRVAAWSAVAAAIVSALWFGTAGLRHERWVKNEAMPRIKRYTDSAQYDSAWLLAREGGAPVPNDSARRATWFRFSRLALLRSIPESASVYRSAFNDTTHWVFLGTTPTDTILVPIGWGRVRVEKPGYRTHYALFNGGARTFLLDSVSAPDSDMVRVPGGRLDAFLVGLEGIPPVTLRDFSVDKHEVTNRQYKAFVEAGGYTKREYWPSQFTADGKPVSWESAIARFIDKTGRPGPATWEAGDYPNGQGDFPVGGVSWYEAAAYAKFAGKSLPTIFHWSRAATIAAARFVVPGSTFEASGPSRGGTFAGMSPFGVFDMAGNVREWCENSAEGDERYILGGGWSDPPYGFTDGYAQRAIDRSAINGIRLMKYLPSDSNLAKARLPQPRAFRDYARERPVSDAAFEGFRHIFDYDRTPLNARVDSRDTTPEDWNIERVSFDAAYGKERVLALLFLPKHQTAPAQPVVFFPGSGVLNTSSSAGLRDIVPSFVVKTGRAAILPILKSTYERHDSLTSDVSDNSIFWRDHVVMWVQDIRRTLDYLETRSDMDSTRFAYFGFSWGANQAPLNLVAEPRFKTAVLYVAGLTMEGSRPEVDPLNYLSRVKIPVLMLNGKYDFFFPVEIAQRPFFTYLGTPADKKKWTVYEGGHDVPRTDLITQTLAWLDKYLGPPRR